MAEQRVAKRETFKDQHYFDEQVRYNAEMLEKFAEKIAHPDTQAAHREQLRHTVFRRQLEQLITRYSRGEPVEALQAAYPRVVDALAEYQQQAGRAAQDFQHFDAYVFALWIVSLAILLDVGDVELRRAVQELNNTGRDALYDRLVALRVPISDPAPTLIYPKPYEPLYEVLDAEREEQTRLIQKFLKQYYKGMKRTYWHDSHLGKDSGFFGYWCFELAVIAKELKIDDSEFSDNIFYPRDLVHWSGRKAR
jgi:hypothetical protein